MDRYDSSQPLAVFFDEVFLEKYSDPTPRQLKRYRNALGRASQVLEHPVTYADVVDFTSFRSLLLEELLKVGFTVGRAESFVACLREIRDAFASELKPARSIQPKRSNFAQFVADYPLSIAATIDMLFPGDEVCIGDVDAMEALQSQG